MIQASVLTDGFEHVATRRREVRVLVLHDSEIALMGCRALLGSQRWVQRCIVSATLEQAVSHASRFEPHVAVVRVRDLGSAGTACARLCAARPGLSILLLAEPARITHRDAVTAGAVGVIPSNLPAVRFVDAVHATASGEIAVATREASAGIALSERELQVIAHLSTGASNREIGAALLLSPQTIKHHVARAYRKLGVHTRLEAVMRAQQLGLLG
jgi:DNA-binding NarL/FixJ family response regulator